MKESWLFLLIPFLLSALFSNAQVSDSIHRISPTPFSGYTIFTNDSLTGFHNDQFDLDEVPFGTAGLPVLPLRFRGYNFNELDASFFDSTLTPVFHKSSIPYTSVKYFVSSLKSQGLSVSHVQPVTGRSVAGVTYRNIRSEGEFQNQHTKSDWINLHYTWTAGRYRNSIYGIFYQLNRQENGGIIDDSLFLERDFQSLLFPVELSDGTLSYKRNWQVNFIQELDLKDSSFSLYHEVNYVYKDFEYMDTTSGYYTNYYLDPYSTTDKTERILYGNKAGLQIRKKKFVAKTYYQTNLINYFSYGFDTISLNNSVRINLFYLNKNNELNLNGNYFLSGYNKSNFQADLSYRLMISDSVRSGVDLSYFSNKPFINHLFYYSNNFKWDNNLKNIQQSMVKGFVDIQTIQLRSEVSVFALTNPVALDTSFNIIQENNTALIYQFLLQKNFRLNRLLNWTSSINFQKVTNSNIIRGPEIIAKTSLFLSGKAWTASYNLGIDGWYYTAWYAHQWVPALNEFALQNSKKYGNFVIIDLFLEAKIKTVKLYIVGSNLTDGFTGINTFVSEGYPFPGRAVRLGIQWDFKN